MQVPRLRAPDELMKRFKRLIEVQRRIASRVALVDDYSLEAVAGVDQAFLGDLVISGAVTLDSSMRAVDFSSSSLKAEFPYVPGFLSFREGPAAVKAVRGLKEKPTLLFVDGCGVNHPRAAGLASYLGAILDVPTVGICKGILCGASEVPEEPGEACPLVYKGKQIGYLLKSAKGCRPIVVGPGYKVSVESSLDLAGKFLKGHKLPEPVRLAHEYVNRVKKGFFK